MAIVDMLKVSFIGLKSEKDSILSLIQNMGSIEINQVDTALEGENENTYLKVAEESLSNLELIDKNMVASQACIDFLKPYNENKKGMFTLKRTVTERDIKNVLDDLSDYTQIVDECRTLESKLAEIRTKETRLTSRIQQLEPWVQLDIPFEHIQPTHCSQLIIGHVDKAFTDSFEKGLSEFQLLEYERLKQNKEDTNYFLIYHNSIKEEVEEKLKEFSFNHASFQNFEGKASDIVRSLQSELKSLELDRNSIVKQATKLCDSMEKLELYYDALSIEKARVESAQKLLDSESIFTFSGWIPQKGIESFEDNLASITKSYYVQYEEPKDGEEYPVMLKNSKLVTPFEMVTSLYNTPDSRGIDPNPSMAPFFFAFFGMMMSDAGYGLILAIVAAIFTKKLKLKGGANKLGWLLSFCGVSTFIWGALFGGWFGSAAEELIGLQPIWFNPLEEPITMLILCFVLGFVHIFVGMGLQAYMSIKKGHLWDAIFDQGLWYILLLGLVFLVLPQTAVAGKYMSIAGAAGLILTQGRNQPGILKKLLSGVMSLYNVTSYLSDVLSYSRLFALGLATGVIATVINQLATMAGSSVIGIIIAAIILAGGHLFNILINALGAFVHASRLQYIEFFGKFFDGGGREFKPLSIKTKYTEYIK